MRRAGQPARLILYLALAVVAASIALAMIVFSGEPTGATEAEVSNGEAAEPAGQSAVASDTGSESSPADTSATEASAIDTSMTEAVEEACRQFESGATVADFSIWFDANWDNADIEETFRAVIETALTETCPEVVPSD